MRNIYSTHEVLTNAECYALFQNIVSRDSLVHMPTGFSMSRERRQPTFQSNRRPDHYIDPAFIIRLLYAMVPALTVGDDRCMREGIKADSRVSYRGSRQQLDALLNSTAMMIYCNLMAHSNLNMGMEALMAHSGGDFERFYGIQRPESPVSRQPRGSRNQNSNRVTRAAVRTGQRVGPSWVVELQQRQVNAEGKLADAAVITAEAARTQAEAARLQAEASLSVAQALHEYTVMLNKIIHIMSKK